MTTAATVVVSAYNVAGRPQVGGHFWVYLQYAHGLSQLGCDVYWLEQIRGGTDSSALSVFFGRMEQFGLAGKAILYWVDEKGDFQFVGCSSARAEAVFRKADLLLNFHYAVDPRMLGRFRRTALMDIDPGLLQFWMSRGQLSVPVHDLYLTIGETVGVRGGAHSRLRRFMDAHPSRGVPRSVAICIRTSPRSLHDRLELARGRVHNRGQKGALRER